MRTFPYYRLVAVCAVAALSLQSDGQNEKENGFARIAKVDPKSQTLTLLMTDQENKKVEVGAASAQLMDFHGNNATVADFKESQYVQYSWHKVGNKLEDIKLTQAFCKRQGPTMCETQAKKKECHHQCSDGPCACPN